MSSGRRGEEPSHRRTTLAGTAMKTAPDLAGNPLDGVARSPDSWFGSHRLLSTSGLSGPARGASVISRTATPASWRQGHMPFARKSPPGRVDVSTEVRHAEALLQTGALQSAIFNSANFSSIATDAKGVIQIFNVGAERMLGYAAADVVNKITPADISDPQ